MGRVWVGRDVWRALAGAGVWLDDYLARHAMGDEGALGAQRHWRATKPESRQRRKVSAYVLPRGGTVWVVSDGDPTQTRVVMPERE